MQLLSECCPRTYKESPNIAKNPGSQHELALNSRTV
jgi:hypothetical protein